MNHEIAALDVPPSLLGESPLWHPTEQVLYWCDIASFALHRFDPQAASHDVWKFDTHVSACAPMRDGGLLLALRDGLWRFDPTTAQRTLLAIAPYDKAIERFNDGKCDPQGRFWVGTVYEPRDPALAALYCFSHGTLARMADGITVSNGLAWSPEGATLYWSCTKAHVIYAFDFDGASGALAHRREWATFPVKTPDQDLNTYGGRPDGAAVDVEGCYWVAMFEGQQLLRLSPEGRVVDSLALPVRCPTMPCFGGPDLKTLYITTARHNRPAAELQQQALAGCVLSLQVSVAGLPTNMFG
ncbi:MAG TPA: SMP-30/gluconolactonase/LRE family protein [Rhizobacter sp.]|nr:SMP-30/gluconolactonase/LRE family protein [Rhizobacter sp.]